MLGRDAQGEPVWNARFLDFALRVGFDPQLCRAYRAQTKGKVERGLRYVGENFISLSAPLTGGKRVFVRRSDRVPF